jgi:hypothetical protein
MLTRLRPAWAAWATCKRREPLTRRAARRESLGSRREIRPREETPGAFSLSCAGQRTPRFAVPRSSSPASLARARSAAAPPQCSRPCRVGRPHRRLSICVGDECRAARCRLSAAAGVRALSRSAREGLRRGNWRGGVLCDILKKIVFRPYRTGAFTAPCSNRNACQSVVRISGSLCQP